MAVLFEQALTGGLGGGGGGRSACLLVFFRHTLPLLL